MEGSTHQRTEPVTTRLTRVERAIVEAAAVAMGLPRSSAIRALVVPAARQRIAEVTQPREGSAE